MDPTETPATGPGETPGVESPGEKDVGATAPMEAASQQAVEAQPAPAEKVTKKDRNWTLIALIAVSVIAVLLLAATICLAVNGDFGHDGRFERFGRPPGPGPMMRQWDGQGQWREGPPPWRQQQQGQEDTGGQDQPQQSAPTPPQGGQTQ